MVGFFIFIGLVVVILVLAYFTEKKRTEKIQEVAKGLGLAFSKKATDIVLDVMQQFKLFNLGRSNSRQAYNHMIGHQNGIDMQVFDYRYTVGHGKSSSTYNQTVLFIESPRLQLPTFHMAPEDIFSRLSTKLGMQDIDFDSHPDFSKKYLLKGSNEALVRQFFTQPILNFFEQDHTKWYFEGLGQQMILYRRNKRMKPDDYTNFIKRGLAFYQLFTQQKAQ